MLRTAQFLMSGRSSPPRKNFPAALTAEESMLVLFPHTSCSILQFFLYLSKANVQYPTDTCEINPWMLLPVRTRWTRLPLVFTITHLFKWLMGNRVKAMAFEPGCFNSLETMSTVFILLVFQFTHFLKHFKGLLIIRILILLKVLGCVLYHQDICWVAD